MCEKKNGIRTHGNPSDSSEGHVTQLKIAVSEYIF